ncbi:Sphingomyelin phosphodiesterase [Sarcoptes scabiei]|nr:Sphingomyelin phosphodiesterase [Sarcoptes scabiei]
MTFKLPCSCLLGSFILLLLVSKLPVRSKPLIALEDESLIETMLTGDSRENFRELYGQYYDVLAGIDISSYLSLLNGGRPNNQTCHGCDTVVKLAKTICHDTSTLGFVKQLICTKDLGPTISRRECEGFVERLGPSILYILNNTKVETDEICSVLLGFECSKFLARTYSKMTYWELKLPEKIKWKPIPIKEKRYQKMTKVLHLTDIHLDLFYEEGSNAKCNEPLCCRPLSYNNKSVPAGHWGQLDGDCDIPLNFLKASLQKIREDHPDIDLIFWTGDNVPHDIWNTSQQTVLEHNTMITKLMKEVFADVKVFPALGNHEAHPINMFPPREVWCKSDFSIEWLYKAAAELWSPWLTEENKKTLRKGGYYSTYIHPGWKVIVMNSNFGYTANFWRLYDPIDPDQQLAWLIEELSEAEQRGSYVTLLGHIPTSDLYDAWSHNFIRIFERFSHLITASYHGHAHTNEIGLIMDKNDDVVGVNFITGSLTTYSQLNPSYKIFELNAVGEPLNFQSYFLEMEIANQQPITVQDLKWRFEFDGKYAYGMTDMTTCSWRKFLHAAKRDLDLAYQYSEHYHRHSRLYPYNFNLTVEKVESLIDGIKKYSPFHHKNGLEQVFLVD